MCEDHISIFICINYNHYVHVLYTYMFIVDSVFLYLGVHANSVYILIVFICVVQLCFY